MKRYLVRPLVYTTVTLRPSEAQTWRDLGRWIVGEKDEPPTPKGLPDLTGGGRVRGGGPS